MYPCFSNPLSLFWGGPCSLFHLRTLFLVPVKSFFRHHRPWSLSSSPDYYSVVNGAEVKKETWVDLPLVNVHDVVIRSRKE